jgi:leader peptidase (prepilin peptidase) / N-methyltransferase
MEIVATLAIAVLGWVLGSLINYLGDVLPETRRFTPAVCRGCQKPAAALDYILMRPCRACGQGRRRRDWLVQALAVGLVVLLWHIPSARLGFWVGLVVLTYFGVVALIDMEHRLILHPVSLVGAVIGAGVGIWLRGWQSTLLGGLAGFGIMLALYYLGFLFARLLSKIKKQEIDEEALGFGDVALSGVLGLMLGWPGITAGLILAILLGGAGSILVIVYTLLTRRYQMFMAIPYGPFLILAAVVLLFRPAM